MKDRNGQPFTDVEEFRLGALWMQAFDQYQLRYLEDRDSTSWVAGQRRLHQSYGSFRRTWNGYSSGTRQAAEDSFVRFHENKVVHPHASEGHSIALLTCVACLGEGLP